MLNGKNIRYLFHMKYVSLCSSRKIAYALFCIDKSKRMLYVILHQQWHIKDILYRLSLSMAESTEYMLQQTHCSPMYYRV